MAPPTAFLKAQLKMCVAPREYSIFSLRKPYYFKYFPFARFDFRKPVPIAIPDNPRDGSSGTMR